MATIEIVKPKCEICQHVLFTDNADGFTAYYGKGVIDPDNGIRVFRLCAICEDMPI